METEGTLIRSIKMHAVSALDSLRDPTLVKHSVLDLAHVYISSRR